MTPGSIPFKRFMRNSDLSLLLDLSPLLAAVRNRQGLLWHLFERAQAVFDFHDVGLFVITPDGQHLSDWAVSEAALSPSNGIEQVNKLAWQPPWISSYATQRRPLIFGPHYL